LYILVILLKEKQHREGGWIAARLKLGGIILLIPPRLK
jgi:hypothetical protein